MNEKMERLRRWLDGSHGLVALSLLYAFLATVCKLAIPFFAGLLINHMDDSIRRVCAPENGCMDETGLLIVLLIFGMVVCLVLGTVFRRLFDYTKALVSQRVIAKMRKALFEAYMDAPIKEIDRHSKGDLIQRLINDIENVQTGLLSGSAALYDGVVTIIVTIIFMFTLSWALALVVVILTPLSALVSNLVSKYNSKHFKAQASTSGRLSSFVNESLKNSTSIRTLGIGEDKEKEFAILNEKFRQDSFKATMGASTINPSTRLINAFINATLVMIGACLIINRVYYHNNFFALFGLGFGIGDLCAFLTYAANYMQPFNEVSDVMSEINYAFSSLERIDKAIHMPKDVDEGKKSIIGSIHSLKADNISFGYTKDKLVINNFSLNIKQGQRIALVGPSGCGKTTLINLFMRFYDPQEGKISVDDVFAEDILKKSLRNRIGMVLQDTWIFTGSVFDNIAYGKENATLDEVRAAAKKAQADGFIERLPQGYDTMISDSSGLSIGEKQLICVARLMLLEPEIVILDEATSNIDVRTEKLLNDSFKELLKGRTSIVVAHRLSTIVSSDLIVVLKDGAIIEQGDHETLLKKKGFYYRLYSAQFN